MKEIPKLSTFSVNLLRRKKNGHIDASTRGKTVIATCFFFVLKGQTLLEKRSTSTNVGGSLNSNLCMVSEKATKYIVFYAAATINKGRRHEKEMKVVDKLA